MVRRPVSVLIVDDDVGMLETLNYIFTDKGYEVVSVKDGFEAIEQIKTRTFDLVLADIRMPDMNGVEVLREIKKLSPNTTTVMMTAYTMHELVEEAKKEGAKAIFSKPLDLDKVISYTGELLTSNRQAIQEDGLEFNELLQVLEEKELEIGRKNLLIDELNKELEEIKKNPTVMLEKERRKIQSEHIETVLKPKQLELFRILCEGEKNYVEILQAVQREKIDIRDMAALRLQMSRLDKKLNQETNYKIEKLRKQGTLYFKILTR